MNYDFIIFGGTGLQGRICARDMLESGYSVLLAGRDPSGISKLLKSKKASFIKVDLRDQNSIVAAIKKSNTAVVVNCAELIFNVPVMKACLATKKPCTDLGGLHDITLEQFKLDQAFRKASILNITGCGSTPGIANVMAAHGIEPLDSVDSIELGFAWDSNLKVFVVPYSIQSIFDEFTDPPVLYHEGKFIKSNRLMCMGTFNFKEIGRQTAYCIVHSEVYTFAKYFKEKGLKDVHYLAGFPKHSLDKIQALLDLGFNSKQPIEVQGAKIIPVDFTSRVLKRLPIPKGYKEIENLWVTISGKKDGKKVETKMNCIVKTLEGWEDAGSNVNTGRTIAIISQMIKNGLIKVSGVFAPEAVVPHDFFFRELGKRKMYVYENGKRIN